jgi:RNA polymerase sporulation-specific sigma factor
MNEAQFEKLKSQYLRLVYLHVKTIARSNPNADFEDLLNAGFIGLWKAANEFDKSLGYKFSTFCVPYIKGEIKNDLRRTSALRSHFHEIIRAPDPEKAAAKSRVKKETAEQYHVAVAIANPISCGLLQQHPTNAIDDPITDPYGAKCNAILIESAMDILNDNERDVIYRLYYLQESLIEIANALSMSVPVITGIRKRALKKFKVNLNIEDFE